MCVCAYVCACVVWVIFFFTLSQLVAFLEENLGNLPLGKAGCHRVRLLSLLNCLLTLVGFLQIFPQATIRTGAL